MARDVVSEALLKITGQNNLGGPLRQAQSQIQQFVRTGPNPLAIAMRTVAVASAAAGAAFAATSAIVLKSASETANLAKTYQSFAERLGASVEGLSELSFVAEKNNVQFSQLAIGMQRMTRRLSEAAKGTGEAQKAIAELGIDTAALLQLPVTEQFKAITTRLSEVENQSDRVRLAFKFFDSEGVALLQTLGGLSGTMQENVEQAHRLGLVMDDESAAAAVAYKDSLTVLQGAFKGLRMTIAGEFFPVLTDIATRITDRIVELRPVIGEFAEEGAEQLEGIAEAVRMVLAEHGDDIKEVLGLAAKAAGQAIEISVTATGGLIKGLATLAEAAEAGLEISLNPVGDTLQNLVLSSDLVERVNEQLAEAGDGTDAFIAGLGNSIRVLISELTGVEIPLAEFADLATAAGDIYAHAMNTAAESTADTQQAVGALTEEQQRAAAEAQRLAATIADLSSQTATSTEEEKRVFGEYLEQWRDLEVQAIRAKQAQEEALRARLGVDEVPVQDFAGGEEHAATEERIARIREAYAELTGTAEESFQVQAEKLQLLNAAFDRTGDIAARVFGIQIADAFGGMIESMGSAVGRSIAFNESFKESATRIWRSFVAEVIGLIVTLIPKLAIAAALKGFLGLGNAKAVADVASIITNFGDLAALSRLQTGGLAPESGKLSGFGGGDRIAALLEAGEYVVRKEAVAALGASFFDVLNQAGGMSTRETITRAVSSPFSNDILNSELQRLAHASDLIRLQEGGRVQVPQGGDGGPAKVQIPKITAADKSVLDWLSRNRDRYRLPKGYELDLVTRQSRFGDIAGREAHALAYSPITLPSGVQIRHLRPFVEGLDEVLRLESIGAASGNPAALVQLFDAVRSLRASTPRPLHQTADDVIDIVAELIGNRRRDAPQVAFAVSRIEDRSFIPSGFGGRATALAGPPRLGQPGGAPLQVGAPGGIFDPLRPGAGASAGPAARSSLSGGGTMNLNVTATTTLGGEAEAEALLTQIVNGISDMGVGLG